MSRTMVVSPIVSALVKSEDILGKDRSWNAVNDWQEFFLIDHLSKRKELAAFSEEELRDWIGFNAKELNRVLEGEGFDVRLDEFGPGEFGVVSILNVLSEWLEEGQRVVIVSSGKKYPGVRMESSSGFEVRVSAEYLYPVTVLPTKSGDKAFMTIAESEAASFSLLTKIDAIRRSLKPGSNYDYDCLKFPMVNINKEIVLGWLGGLWTIQDDGRKAEISQVFQQTKFRMNQRGARTKSAVALGAFTASARKEKVLLIDKPFFFWIEREGMSIPIIYAYIDQEDWKDPGIL